jgi:uncharacterized protein YfiM (DUF2279 family)
MARWLLVAALLLTGQGCFAEDDWFGGDKRAHFIGGLLVGGAFSAGTGSHTPGIVTGCGVGVFGELIEVARYGVFSPQVSAKDFAAGCAGGLVGAYIGVLAAPNDRVASAKAKAPNDSWTSGDKRAHFIGAMALSGAVAHFTDSATVGLLSGCALGFGGELIDASKSGWHSKHVSAKDAVAGCLGGVAGAFAGVAIAPNRIVWTKQF